VNFHFVPNATIVNGEMKWKYYVVTGGETDVSKERLLMSSYYDKGTSKNYVGFTGEGVDKWSARGAKDITRAMSPLWTITTD